MSPTILWCTKITVRVLAAAGKRTVLDLNLAAARKQTVNQPSLL